MPQSGGCFSNLTCLENLKAISEIVLKNKDERSFRIEKMISKFELDAVKNTKAKYLSGGQRKKGRESWFENVPVRFYTT